jgi:hypothetical protein
MRHEVEHLGTDRQEPDPLPSLRVKARRFTAYLRRRWRFIAVEILVSLCLAELVLHQTAPWLPPRLPFTYEAERLDPVAMHQANFDFDSQLGWILRPGADPWWFQAWARHNSAGMRADREYAPAPAPARRRISAYGDSFTFCLEVELDDCWTTLLEDGIPRSEVLNFGVPGYAPDQAWIRYQRDGASWSPCAVLIGHMTENITRVVNRFRPFLVPTEGLLFPKPRFVLTGDRLELLPIPTQDIDAFRDPAWVEATLDEHDTWYFPGTFVAHPLDRLELVRLVRTIAYLGYRPQWGNWRHGSADMAYRPGTEAFEVLRAVLVRFADEVRRDGRQPVVVVFPTRFEVQARLSGSPLPHRALLDALQEADVPTIDLTDALTEAVRQSTAQPLGKEHYTYLGHFTQAGNMVVARTLARELPSLIGSSCT